MNKKGYLPLVWFVLGFGIFVFTRMSKLVPTIPVAILIAPVFILRFIRTQPSRHGNLLTLVGFLLSINIGLWGVYEGGEIASSLFVNLLQSSLLAILYFLPFMTDRLMYPKFKNKGSLSTLIFPVVTTGLFFFLTREGPFEGAVQMGKFVYGPIALKQLISLFGPPAFVFVTSWFASIINYAWENDFNWSKSKTIAIAYGVLVLAVFAFGAIKTSSLVVPESDTVKMAAVVFLPEDGKKVGMDTLLGERYTHPFDERMSEIENKTQIAASNGAKIVTFQEFSILINEEDREELTTRCQEIAKENNVYLAVNYAYYAEERQGQNLILLVDDNGGILLEYAKKYLLGMGDILEAGVFKKGPEIIQSVDTPYGRIALSICREIDMTKYMVQAGRQNVDIMISPAYEWPTNLVINYGYMRAIENGFSLIRPTYNGISFAMDFNGNILSQMPFDEAGDGIMYADVPTKGVKTLYPQIGNIFGWLCVVGLLGLIPTTIVLRIKQKKEMA